MIDAHGRKVNYLRLSVTDRCNLRCQYCMPVDGISKLSHGDIMSHEQFIQIVDAMVDMGIDKIRLTGGEPLVRKGLLSLVRHIGQKEEIKDFAMTTNGILLHQHAAELKAAGLMRVNVSIDSLNDARYAQMTRGGRLSDVLKGIEMAKKVGLTPIKLNVVLIGGFNEDEIDDFVAMTKDEAIDVRFIELMPIGEVAKWNVNRYLPNDAVLSRVPELMSIDIADRHSPARYFRLSNGKGRVGLISPISCSFCSECNRIRITSRGKLKYCLHADDELDLVNIIEHKGDLAAEIDAFMMKKPASHHLNEGNYIKRNMFQIGG